MAVEESEAFLGRCAVFLVEGVLGKVLDSRYNGKKFLKRAVSAFVRTVRGQDLCRTLLRKRR